MTGAIRVFTNENIQLNIQNNVLDPIGGPHHRELFFVFDEAARDDPAIAGIRRRFSPTALEFLDRQAAPPNSCSFNGHQSLRIPGFYDQYAKVKFAFLLVRRHERSVGHLFDFVIRLRPDVVWPRPLQAISLFSTSAITSISGSVSLCSANLGSVNPDSASRTTISGDLFAVLPRRLAGAYMNVVDEHFVCRNASEFRYCHICLRPGIESVPPECILWRRFNELHVPVQQLSPFSTCVVRSIEGSNITRGKNIGRDGCKISLGKRSASGI